MKFRPEVLHRMHPSLFTTEEEELYELSLLADVNVDPAVFKIILDLLSMNVTPLAIEQMLKSMTKRSQKSTPATTSSRQEQTTSRTARTRPAVSGVPRKK